MKSKYCAVPFLFLLIAIIFPATTHALPDQCLMICVKRDQSAIYQSTDPNGSWDWGGIGVINFADSPKIPEGHTYWGGADIVNSRSPHMLIGLSNFNSLTGSESVDNFNGNLIVNGNGSIDFTTNRSFIINDLRGFLSANRQYLLGVDGIVWNGPGANDVQLKMDFAIRRSTGKTNADLNGTYHIRSMELFETSSGSRVASLDWGTLTFDGAAINGGYTYSLDTYLSDGTTTSSPVTGSGNYLVQNPGSIDFMEPPLPSWTGHMSDDGNAIYAALGCVTPLGTDHSTFSIGIKASNRAFSNADLNGEYFTVLLGIDDMQGPGRNADLIWGTFAFDGGGNFTMSVLNQLHADDNTGTTDSLFNNSGSYTVSASGEVQITFDTIDGLPDTAVFEGHLSDDNEIMSLSSAVSSNTGSAGGAPPAAGGGGGGGGCFIGSIWTD